MQDDLNEIKNRISIDVLIGEYIPIQKAGSNFKACCPFHNEKTPSLIISPQKQIWHCFGCGVGGDIFTFVQKMENVDFVESLKILANKAGITLNNTNKNNLSNVKDEKEELIKINTLATKFFHFQLFKNQEATLAKEYLKNRNISKESVLDFQIGYSLDSWDALLKYLKSNGFKESQIEEVGLIIKKDNANGYYDRFRERIMFPIKNSNGDILGFGGRIIKSDEKSAKYINSPQTQIYNKSNIVYGLFDGKKAIKENNFVIVVEGYMDVIMNHQVGVKNVVASSGTAFTVEQLRILKRYTNTLVFCFDSDNAGKNALIRGVDLALAEDMKIKIIQIPPNYGKDPDECIRKDVNVWKNAIQKAVPMMWYYIDSFVYDFQNQDIDKKTQSVKFLVNLASKIKDTIERAYWLQEISKKSDIRIDELNKILNENLKNSKYDVKIKKTQNENKENKILKIENLSLKDSNFNRLISFILTFPEFIENMFIELRFEQQDSELNKILYKYLLTFYNSNNSTFSKNNDELFDYKKFAEYIFKCPHQENDEEFHVILKNFNQDKLVEFFDLLFLKGQNLYINLSKEDIKKEFYLIVEKIKDIYTQNKISQISKLLDTEKDIEKIKQLSNEFNKLVKERKN